MTHENEAMEQPKEASGTATTITTKCLDVVKRYHTGTISKGDTIYEFTKAIPIGEVGATESVGKTLKSYVLTLEDWDQERTLTDMDEQREGGQERPGLDVNLGPHKRTERSDEGVHRHLKINPECFPWAVSDRVEGSTM